MPQSPHRAGTDISLWLNGIRKHLCDREILDDIGELMMNAPRLTAEPGATELSLLPYFAGQLLSRLA